MKFKNNNLKDEFEEIDLRLREAFIEVDETIPGGIMVTCLKRTPAYNKEIGGHPESGHIAEPCESGDFRSWMYTPVQLNYISLMLKGWNSKLRKLGVFGGLHRKETPGVHFHMQVPKVSK